MSVYWKDPNDETVAILTKESNEIVTLRVGDFITYKRRPDGVKITGFISKQTDTRGPISLTYLPWRVNEKQWGPTVFTLKGNCTFCKKCAKRGWALFKKCRYHLYYISYHQISILVIALTIV
jgi:hypothetical protein